MLLFRWHGSDTLSISASITPKAQSPQANLFLLTHTQVATTIQVALFVSAIPHGAGRHNYYVSQDDQVKASRLLFLSQLPWGWGVALGKISISLLLLRLKTSPGWRVFLHAMIAVQVASALCLNTIQLARCRPISAAWRFDTEATQCLRVRVMHIAMYTNGAIAVITDVMLALTPLTFLRSIRRSTRERSVIATLMGLGLVAAAGAVVRMTLMRTYGQTGDILWDCVALITWSVVEAQLGIVAACVPCLKSPSERALRRVGLLSEPPTSYRLSSTGDMELGAAVPGPKGNVASGVD